MIILITYTERKKNYVGLTEWETVAGLVCKLLLGQLETRCKPKGAKCLPIDKLTTGKSENDGKEAFSVSRACEDDGGISLLSQPRKNRDRSTENASVSTLQTDVSSKHLESLRCLSILLTIRVDLSCPDS